MTRPIHLLLAARVLMTLLTASQAFADEPNRSDLLGGALYGQADGEYTDQVNKAGIRFRALLPTELRVRIQFGLEDDEREQWHYVPVSLRTPPGVRVGELPVEARIEFHRLMRTVLSGQGYLKSNAVMQLHDLYYYHATESPPEDQVGIGHYYVALFGEPGTPPWGWKVVGYHHSLEFYVSHDRVDVTPALLGSLPDEAKDTDLAGYSVLAFEKQHALDFLRSLSDEQRSVVLQPEELPRNIYFKPDVESAPEPVGLPASQLSAEQLRLLYRLIATYLTNYRPEIANEYWAMAKAEDLMKLRFAWWGSVDEKGARYYRIHGERLWIEYDNPRETRTGEADPNHVHLIFRDLANDHGRDLLKEHYRQQHNTD